MSKNCNVPLVSVIIPTFKRPKKLLNSIGSVLNQTYSNFEILVIDDNNRDDIYRKETKKFMYRYANDSRIKYYKHLENRGGAAARNTGIKKAQGEFIAFLDDDDEWDKFKLNKSINRFNNYSKEYGVVFSSYYVNTKKYTFKERQPKLEGDIYRKELLKDYVGPTSTVIAKKECFNKVGFFDEDLPARQDYDMWIRISKYYKFTYIDEPLVNINRKGSWIENSISSNYKNNIEGTKIIISKIEEDLNNFDLDFRNNFYAEQYKSIGKMLINFKQFDLGKKYLLKSLRKKIKISTLGFFILVNISPNIWELLRKIRRKI